MVHRAECACRSAVCNGGDARRALLCISIKLAFEARAELRRHEAFAPSGMSDPGASS
jgi:hypothetical protein